MKRRSANLLHQLIEFIQELASTLASFQTLLNVVVDCFVNLHTDRPPHFKNGDSEK